jgi:hypothetical protein
MNNTQTIHRDYESIAWGAIFLWWGVTELIPAVPDGAGALGFGLILLGLNASRALKGIAINWFSTGVGILALVWGGLELAGALLALPFELPIFAILLITLGLLLIGREVMSGKA